MKRQLSAIIDVKPNHHSIAILLPGFLDSNQSMKMRIFKHGLHGLGYSTLRLDPCGLWYGNGSEKEYTVTRYLKDIEIALDLMHSEIDNPQVVLLLGHSLGAFLALEGLAHKEGWKEQGFKVSTRSIPTNTRRVRTFRVPYSTAKDMLKYSALNVIGELTTKLMIYISLDDESLPPSETEKLVSKAKDPFVIRLNNMGHHFNDSRKDTLRIWHYIKSFLSI